MEKECYEVEVQPYWKTDYKPMICTYKPGLDASEELYTFLNFFYLEDLLQEQIDSSIYRYLHR